MCNNNPRCHYFTWRKRNKGCLLKSSNKNKQEGYSAADAISGQACKRKHILFSGTLGSGCSVEEIVGHYASAEFGNRNNKQNLCKKYTKVFEFFILASPS